MYKKWCCSVSVMFVVYFKCRRRLVRRWRSRYIWGSDFFRVKLRMSELQFQCRVFIAFDFEWRQCQLFLYCIFVKWFYGLCERIGGQIWVLWKKTKNVLVYVPSLSMLLFYEDDLWIKLQVWKMFRLLDVFCEMAVSERFLR